MLVALLASSAAWAETVTLFLDTNVPQHRFAAGDLQAALKDKGHVVLVKDLTDLPTAAPTSRIIVALQAQRHLTDRLSSEGGQALPVLGAQAFSLRTTRTTRTMAKTCWVFGGDVNGAMYGGLEFAEQVRFDGWDADHHADEAPFLKQRGIKFNIPLDKASPTYFYGHQGTSHKLAIADVWDMRFWQTWFDEMARQRYNLLSLWSPHPFTSLLNLEDEYPGIAITGVTGFDAQGKEVEVNALTIDEKIAFWRSVMRYGKERGFQISFCNWNIFLSSAEGKHGLSNKPDNQQTIQYLRRCTERFLETYPDLDGFGITVGEKMGSLDVQQKEEWAWSAYGQGFLDYARRHPQRNLVFIHRQHDGDIDHILTYFSPLSKLPNVRFELSCKYSEAHAHTTTTPSRWHRTGMEAGLAKYGLTSLLTIRNDDFYFLHWAEPQFVREYLRGFPGVGTFVNGFYIGADGWVFAKEFVSRHPFFAERDVLEIERTWLMQKLWGRLSYNPDTSDDVFIKSLAARFPGTRVEALFEAWTSASGALRRANEQVTGRWQFDQDFWPEMWTGDNWKDNGRHLTLDDTKEATPFAGSRLCSLAETVSGKGNGKIPAWDNVAAIDRLARRALTLLVGIDADAADAPVELRLTVQDIRAQAHLGLYNAEKFRAVLHDVQGKRDEARSAMGKAYWHWRDYTDLMAALYRPVAMQRNKSFSSWHDYDDAVLQEFLRLGGTGMPPRSAE
jgi:hypothetical protein